MSIINYPIIKVNHKKILTNGMFLSSYELYYIRLYIHNYSLKEIGEYLDIEQQKVYEIKYLLKKKFHTNSFLIVIEKALAHNIVNKKDFTDTYTKDYITQITHETYKFLSSINIYKAEVSINKKLLFYYESYMMNKRNIYKNLKNLDKLNNSELELINLKHLKKTEDNICHQMKISILRYKKIESNIFKKLKVKNWINAFKIAYQYGLLNKYWEVNENNSLTKNTSINIKKVNFDKSLLVAEKKSIIYNNLLELFTKIEFNSIFF